ncbi:MAG: response regulator [Albidovulum sp.]
MAATTILVVEDDPGVRTLLRRCLEDDGYAVTEAQDGAEVLAAIRKGQVGLITLDLNLAGSSGIEIARAVRRESDVPIIMVTGRGDVVDRIVGLEIGADDYLAKPFHLRELLARVHSVLRRTRPRAEAAGGPSADAGAAAPAAEAEALSFAEFVARPATMELRDPSGAPVELTSGDFRLLQVFLEHPRRVLSRERIMDLLNGAMWSPLDRTIDNQVARLRKKIERVPSDPQLIKTVRGVGYIFTPEVVRLSSAATA